MSDPVSDMLIWDNHGCMPLRPDDTHFMPQLKRYRDAGVDVVMLNVGFGDMPWHSHFRMLASFRAWLRAHSDQFRIIDSVDDIAAAKKAGQLAIGFDIEGGGAIDDQPDLVGAYYNLGVRWMLIAYNQPNRLGGGCQGEDGGLTDFGRRVIEEMQQVGMVTCCTHTGERTAADVIAYSQNPVIFSHSNARAIHDHPRNLSDEIILACAAKGGVIGVNGIGIFLGENDNRTETLLRHIDHIVQLAGPRHVGLGLDYVFDASELDDFISKMRSTFPEDLGYRNSIAMIEPERVPAIAEALFAAYGDEVASGILGGNFLRIARQVWK